MVWLQFTLHIGLSVSLLLVMVCRLNQLTSDHHISYRAACVLMACASLSIALMPTWDTEPARWPGLMLMGSLLWMFISSSKRWENGPPSELLK